MKLSKVQKATLDKMVVGKEYCAYDLGVSVRTMDALVKRGILTKKMGLGPIYSPRIRVDYSRKF